MSNFFTTYGVSDSSLTFASLYKAKRFDESADSNDQSYGFTSLQKGRIRVTASRVCREEGSELRLHESAERKDQSYGFTSLQTVMIRVTAS